MDKKRKAAGRHHTANLSNKIHSNRDMYKSKNKLPPFGRRLVARNNNCTIISNDIFLFVGCDKQSWDVSKNFFYRGFDVLLYLGDLSPDEYRWPVRSRSILVSIQNILPWQTIRFLSYVLLNSGAVVVYVIKHSRGFAKFMLEDCDVSK